MLPKQSESVNELHALSVSDMCPRWNSDRSGDTLWPNVAMLNSQLNQPIWLARFDPSTKREGRERLALLHGSWTLLALLTRPATILYHLVYITTLPEVSLSLWAAQRGVHLEDIICAAASWASLGTFSRCYRVNVATPYPLCVVLFKRSSDSNP